METGQVFDDALIPIVFGVTGHRDLRQQNIEGLKQKVQEIFREIMGKCPNSPILLLSPLAEGADRLVAKVALKLGASLVVPLPMPIDEYRRDFKDQTSQSEFSELLNKSTRYFELPLVHGNTPQNIATNGEYRDRQYTQIGAYIAQHSRILIALWDGKISNKKAGTSAIVRFKLEGVPRPYARPPGPLTLPESGPVYQILTPRVSNPNLEGESSTPLKLFPEYWGNDQTQAEKAYDKILKHVDDYNLDVRKGGSKLIKRATENKRQVLPEDQENTIEPACHALLTRYAVSDTIAQIFKRRRFIVIKGLFLVVLIGFLFFQVYLELSRSPWILLAYPVIVGFSALFYLLAKARKYENKHEDYRALSEAMRVQFFWRITGMGENVADHYLRKHTGVLEWIRYAVRVWSIPLCDETRTEPESYHLALKRWVEDQSNWFQLRSEQDKSKLRKSNVIGNWLFIFGLIVALVLSVLQISNVLGETTLETIHPWMVLAIGMSLATAAAVKGYLEKIVLSEQSKQYERMAGSYVLASEKLREALSSENFAEARKLLLEVGKEALIENGDWLLLHRAQQLEVPVLEAKPRMP
jgi:hypothetical protein